MEDADFSSGENFAKSLTPDLFGFAFAIPVLFGMGEFWYLSDDEEKEMSDSSWLFISSRPKSQRKIIERYINEWLPLLMFLLTFGVITGKRINLSYQAMKAARKPKLYAMPNQKRSEQNEPNNESSESGEEQTNETAASGSVKRVLSDPISQTFGQYPG